MWPGVGVGVGLGSRVLFVRKLFCFCFFMQYVLTPMWGVFPFCFGSLECAICDVLRCFVLGFLLRHCVNFISTFLPT